MYVYRDVFPYSDFSLFGLFNVVIFAPPKKLLCEWNRSSHLQDERPKYCNINGILFQVKNVSQLRMGKIAILFLSSFDPFFLLLFMPLYFWSSHFSDLSFCLLRTVSSQYTYSAEVQILHSIRTHDGWGQPLQSYAMTTIKRSLTLTEDSALIRSWR